MNFRKTFFFISIFLCSSSIFSLDFNFSITKSTGFLSGSYKEKLLCEIDDCDRTISLLDWKITSAPIIDLTTSFNLNKKYEFGFNLLYTIPINIGRMEDFDWKNWYSSQTGELTHYSRHENQLNDLYDIMSYAGFNIPINKKIQIQPRILYSYKYYDFTAINGYRQYSTSISDVYPQWTNDIQKKYLNGAIINYKGEEYSLGLGGKIDYNITDDVTINADLNFLSALKAITLDSHLNRNKGKGLFLLYDNTGKFTLKSKIFTSFAHYDNYSIYFGGQAIYTIKNNAEINGYINTGNETSFFFSFTIGYTFTYEM